MSLQIKSFEEYQDVYKQSVENPEDFWAGLPKISSGNVNGQMYWTGILRSQRLSGLREER